MSNHGTWAKKGDLVRILNYIGNDTGIHAIVLETAKNDWGTPMVRIKNQDQLGTMWMKAAFVRIVTKGTVDEV